MTRKDRKERVGMNTYCRRKNGRYEGCERKEYEGGSISGGMMGGRMDVRE